MGYQRGALPDTSFMSLPDGRPQEGDDKANKKKMPETLELDGWLLLAVIVESETWMSAVKLREEAQAMPWINEIEKAKTCEKWSTSQSVTGTATGDVETSDSKVAGCLMNSLLGNFRKRVLVEKKAQQNSRFVTGRQVARKAFDVRPSLPFTLYPLPFTLYPLPLPYFPCCSPRLLHRPQL